MGIASSRARRAVMGKKTASASREEPLEIECTINLGKKLSGVAQKKRAPRATREIKKVAKRTLGTSDVRIDMALNKHLWSRGIRHVPNRVRVRLSRRVNEADDAQEKMYAFVTHVPMDSFKGVLTQAVEEA